jgi:hypothetical protein
MAHLEQEIPGPCVVLAQESKDTLLSLILGKAASTQAYLLRRWGNAGRLPVVKLDFQMP